MPPTWESPSSEQLITFLKSVALFRELPESEIHRIVETSDVRHYTLDHEFTVQGQHSDALFVLVEGAAAAYVASGASVRQIRRFAAGDCFDVASVIVHEPSRVTVWALSSVRAVVVPRNAMDALFETSLVFNRSVCRALADFVSSRLDQLPSFPFRSLDEFPNLSSSSQLLPLRISMQLQAIVVEHDEDRVVVGIVNPSDTRAIEFISDVLRDYRVEFVAISRDDFDRGSQRLFPPTPEFANIDDRQLGQFQFVSANGDRKAITDGGPASLAKALAQAIQSGASDVHISAKHSSGAIHFRVDGRIVPFSDGHSGEEMRQLVSRVKVAAGLDITNVRRPQDGRFRIESEELSTEFRISALPSEGGEKIVLRASSSRMQVEFNRLFVSHAAARFASDIFSQPNGLVLVTGPTGSGKTTTLYSALQMLRRQQPDKNFVTVEDPVEYPLDFATQARVDVTHNLSFPQLLRTVLRQDPDVILVGEIRDRESAAMAVEAATTGHLVLSTLHTYSALETLVRLRNLDVPRYLLAESLKGVICQQLLPKRTATNGQHDETATGNAMEHGRQPMGMGRVALFEMLAVSDTLSDVIDRDASRAELSAAMQPSSYLSFERYAQLLVEQGLVAAAHVQRVLPKMPIFDA